MNDYTNKYPPGTTVRLTGQFLRSTGQIAGGEGQSKWIVQPCDCGLCATGQYVRTDEPKGPESLEMFTRAELAEHPALHWRHIAKSNLCTLSELTVRNCP